MPPTINEQFTKLTSVSAASLAEGDANAAGEDSSQGSKQGAEIPDGKLPKGAGAEAGGDTGAEGTDAKESAGEDKKPTKGALTDADASDTGEQRELSELEQLKEDLRIANERTEALLARLSSPSPTAEAVKEEPIKVAEFSLEAFMSDDEYLAATETKEGFEKILHKVAKASYDQGATETLKVVPSMIKKEVTEAIVIREALAEFWQNNLDMKPYKAVFAQTIDSIQKKEPGLTLEMLLQKAEIETRMQMKLPQKKQEAAKPKKVEDPDKKPAFVNGSQSRVEAAKRSKIQEDFLKLSGKVRT